MTPGIVAVFLMIVGRKWEVEVTESGLLIWDIKSNV